MAAPSDKILCTYSVLVDNGNLPMLKRSGTGFMDGCWGLVSGRMEGGETFREGIAREAREEANIDLDPSDFEIVHALHRNQHYNDGEVRERVDIFFKAKKMGRGNKKYGAG